ncbi:M48 family metalloprotease [Streptomyces sp. Ag109_O5-10]|uniref:M48 family metalloprotease n=1 Tax=Streptomyces sp. Ag109_O5-10 TaxID=1855349 RepID=UPI00089AB3B7|nr:M48 family metallopeptidase [Streptomyces sp. Ag109_O5-10]SEE99919.1 Zn-dependent protease with chaperone function [Streptomyces sp. Ag109_O5-10]
MRLTTRPAGRAAAVEPAVRERGVPGTPLRAALVLGLLLGFYALALLLLLVLAVLDVFLARGPGLTVVAVEGYLGSLAIAWCVVRVVLLTRGPGDGQDEVPGVSLTPGEQPELWWHVRNLAERVGTRPPAEIRVVPGANAMVREDARWLGLVAGERRLFLGVTLLIGLSQDELDAVLGHELGHYAHDDTRLGGLLWALHGRLQHTVHTLRRRAADEEAEERARTAARAARRRAAGRRPALKREPKPGPDHYLALVFCAYARLCLRLTEAVSRRQEYAADLVAARVAGRDTTAAALRRIPALDAAEDLYLREYALMGQGAGLLPPEGQFHGGLAQLLADPARRAELDAWTHGPLQEVASEESSPYDSHPLTADRIAALEALPELPRLPDLLETGRTTTRPRHPALALLREPDRVLTGLERAVLSRETLSWRRVPWAELPAWTRRESWAREAQPLLDAMAEPSGARSVHVSRTSAVPHLHQLLDLIDHGLLHDIAGRLPRSEQAGRSSGRAAREFARTAFRSALRRLALLTALDTGLCRWELCWSGPAVRTVAPDGFAEALEEALDHAVAEPPGTFPLRALLAGGGHTRPASSTVPSAFSPGGPYPKDPE